MCLIYTRIRQILCPIGVPYAAFCFAKILLSTVFPTQCIVNKFSAIIVSCETIVALRVLQKLGLKGLQTKFSMQYLLFKRNIRPLFCFVVCTVLFWGDSDYPLEIFVKGIAMIIAYRNCDFMYCHMSIFQ